jgi:hypothetical protein
MSHCRFEDALVTCCWKKLLALSFFYEYIRCYLQLLSILSVLWFFFEIGISLQNYNQKNKLGLLFVCLFTVLRLAQEFPLIWRRHHCRWRVSKFRPRLGAQGLCAGKDLYRAPPAVTQGLGFSGLIRRTVLFSRLLRHAKGCGGFILTGILTDWNHSNFFKP